MSVLLKMAVDRANASNRIRLEAWLGEWVLDRSIRKAAIVGLSGGPAGPGAALAGGGTSCRSVPAEGQVIILPPASASLAEGRPLYVLVLKQMPGGPLGEVPALPERCLPGPVGAGASCMGELREPVSRGSSAGGSDKFLVAPFSRFSTPATDHEWKTGLRSKPLRVLCLWNAHKVSVRALSAGWLTAHLSQIRHQQALKAYEQSMEPGGPGGDGSTKAFGPPLRHPLDPRHEYLAEEAALMDEHLQELESQTRDQAGPSLYSGLSSTLLKAAEGRPAYGRRSGRQR